MNHDHSRLWPDTFLKTVNLKLSPQNFPRECKIDDDTPVPWIIEGETYSIKSIYFTKTDTDSVKEKIVSQLNGQVKYMSKVDVQSATLWMLFLELRAIRKSNVKKVKTEADLNISGTVIGFLMDLATNKSTLIPQNYFGNGYIWVHAEFPINTTTEQRNQDLFSTLTGASMAIRKQVLAHRSPKVHAKKALDTYKKINDESIKGVKLSCVVSSYFRMPFSEMEFEQGPPIFNYATSSCPYWPNAAYISPGSSPGDIIVNLTMLKGDKQNAVESSVLRTLFPGARFLSRMNALDLAKTVFA